MYMINMDILLNDIKPLLNKNKKQINPIEGKQDNDKMNVELESVNPVHA